jgi:hypothetical protein
VGNEKLNILILIWNLNFCQYVFWQFILGVKAFQADFLTVSVRRQRQMKVVGISQINCWLRVTDIGTGSRERSGC